MVLSCRRRREDGVVAILVAIMVTVMFGLVAIVIDLGLARVRHQQAQDAADSAAITAAMVMLSTGNQVNAKAAAGAYALTNFAVSNSAWTACSDCVTFDTSMKTVTVRLPRLDSPVSFGGIYGVSSIGVSAIATASWGSTLPGDCLLCVVDDSISLGFSNGDAVVNKGNVRVGDRLTVQSGTTLDVNKGSAFYWINSGLPPTVDAGYQNIAGVSFVDPYSGNPNVNNPWNFLGLPSSLSPASAISGGLCKPLTGKLVGYLTASAASHCTTFAAGMYVIIPGGSGAALTPGSAGPVTGSGVLLFATCAFNGLPAPCQGTNTNGAAFDRLAANVTLSGITASSDPTLAPFQGFTIIIDRGNSTGAPSGPFGNTSPILGSTQYGDLKIDGNVYDANPNRTLILNDRTTINGQLITADSLQVGYSGACDSSRPCLTLNAPTTVRPPIPSSVVRLVPNP